MKENENVKKSYMLNKYNVVKVYNENQIQTSILVTTESLELKYKRCCNRVMFEIDSNGIYINGFGDLIKIYMNTSEDSLCYEIEVNKGVDQNGNNL